MLDTPERAYLDRPEPAARIYTATATAVTAQILLDGGCTWLLIVLDDDGDERAAIPADWPDSFQPVAAGHLLAARGYTIDPDTLGPHRIAGWAPDLSRRPADRGQYWSARVIRTTDL
jgi:hypothetical protein